MEHMDGKTDGQTDGRTDGRTERRTEHVVTPIRMAADSRTTNLYSTKTQQVTNVLQHQS